MLTTVEDELIPNKLTFKFNTQLAFLQAGMEKHNTMVRQRKREAESFDSLMSTPLTISNDK
jgi:hypothetical protein